MKRALAAIATCLVLLTVAVPTAAQSPAGYIPAVEAGPPRNTLISQPITFDATGFQPPPDSTLLEVLWDFGDGVRTTGSRVSHAYTHPGTYLVTLRLTTDTDTFTDTTEIHVYQHAMVLVSDLSAPEDQLILHQQQAAKNGVLLVSVRADRAAPEVLVEEELTKQLIDAQNQLAEAHVIVMWTSGSVGANVLTKFAQHMRQLKAGPPAELALGAKGIILISKTPFSLLQPSGQAAFDQLQPAYVILSRPQALDLLTNTTTAEEAKTALLASPLEYRLLGTFSARTVSDLGLTNFMSFAISYLVNRGVPINSLVLILMLPVIATILAFARQIIGIKAFGLLTPAMTTVSFLVMGLRYGLIVFLTILAAGTLTRFILHKLRLLYVPRMALVLTSVSLSLLVLLGLDAARNHTSSSIAFSIFPALILTILAEDFIAAQFKSGLRTALTVTAWTLLLATVCYATVSSDLFRTLILSYPELTLLALPINVALGRFSGLRLTEYFRFRDLLRHGRAAP